MRQLVLITEQVKSLIERICEQQHITIKGNMYLHTENEEINLQISAQRMPNIIHRKLGGFYDTLSEKRENSTRCNQKFTDYFSHICERKDIKESTKKAYSRTLDTLKAYAPEAEFQDIDKHFIKGYETYLISLNMKNNTVLKNLKHLKKSINSANIDGHIKSSTKELFSEVAIRPEKCHKESLNHSEVLQLHEYLTENFHTLPEKERETLSGLLFEP